mgnify:CR=1 FL=1
MHPGTVVSRTYHHQSKLTCETIDTTFLTRLCSYRLRSNGRVERPKKSPTASIILPGLQRAAILQLSRSFRSTNEPMACRLGRSEADRDVWLRGTVRGYTQKKYGRIRFRKVRLKTPGIDDGFCKLFG